VPAWRRAKRHVMSRRVQANPTHDKRRANSCRYVDAGRWRSRRHSTLTLRAEERMPSSFRDRPPRQAALPTAGTAARNYGDCRSAARSCRGRPAARRRRMPVPALLRVDGKPSDMAWDASPGSLQNPATRFRAEKHQFRGITRPLQGRLQCSRSVDDVQPRCCSGDGEGQSRRRPRPVGCVVALCANMRECRRCPRRELPNCR